MEDKLFEHIVIYEDNHLLVINKPNNVLVQGDITGDKTILGLAKNYIKIKYNKPGNVFLGLVHRLDRPVSGALILAKTSKALSRLNEQFRSNQISKTYLAISNRKPDLKKGRIENLLLKDGAKNRVSIVTKLTKLAKLAQTEYHYIGVSDKCHLFKLQPITGRSHQLRVHMKHLNCSIIGDLKYGAKKALDDKSIGLHCYQMMLTHPTTKELLKFEAIPPKTSHWKKINKLLKNV